MPQITSTMVNKPAKCQHQSIRIRSSNCDFSSSELIALLSPSFVQVSHFATIPRSAMAEVTHSQRVHRRLRGFQLRQAVQTQQKRLGSRFNFSTGFQPAISDDFAAFTRGAAQCRFRFRCRNNPVRIWRDVDQRDVWRSCCTAVRLHPRACSGTVHICISARCSRLQEHMPN